MSADEFYIAFGRRLVILRETRGMSEEEAAKAYGVTLRTSRKYEKGGHHGNNELDHIMRFAARCDVSAEWLLSGPYLN
jgi:transcriptional regulator with XRE-family HTH domain